MDDNVVLEACRKELEQLFNAAKQKLGSWTRVAEEMKMDYTSIARLRRGLQNNHFLNYLTYYRLRSIVYGRDFSL